MKLKVDFLQEFQIDSTFKGFHRWQLPHRDDFQRFTLFIDLRRHLQHFEVRRQSQKDQNQIEEKRLQCGFPSGSISENCRRFEVSIERM